MFFLRNKYKTYKSFIKPLAVGERCQFIKPSNIYGCTLGDNVFVGPFCEIQNDVLIGNHTRIQSHTFICSLVVIGDNCRIGHGVMFINDLYRECKKLGEEKRNWESTTLGSNCLIGSNATILPVQICDNVIIGAGSVVSKDIKKPGVYAGNPAKFLRSHIVSN